MFKNYIKVTLRNIRKDKWYSLINVIGLTIGIAGSLLIYLFITHELSFDNFHNNNIYRVVKGTETSTGMDYESSVPYPIINSLNSDYSSFSKATLYHDDDEPVVTYNGENFILDDGMFADSSFFEIFNYEIISGDPRKSLGEPGYAFLSESTVEKIFGEEDPLGAKIKIRNMVEAEVAGVFRDVPLNSSLKFDIVVSYPSFSKEYMGNLDITSWNMSAEGRAFVQLPGSVTKDRAEEEIALVMKKYYTGIDADKRHFYLQPVTEMHYDTRFNSSAVDIKSLVAIGVIGAFILLLGCVNFINLSTALAVRKAKEVGVRKTLGATAKQLVMQFMGETLIITTFSGLISLAVIERMLPLFNAFFETNLALNILKDGDVLLFTLTIVVLVTLLAGAYPAFILSSYNATKALKSNIHSQSKTSLFMRKGLITSQFVISQVLIIATVIVAYQMNFFNNKPLGYDKDGIVTVYLEDNEPGKLEILRERLLQNPSVTHVSYGLDAPSSDNTFETNFRLASADPSDDHDVEIKPVDRHYLETFGLELLHGRWLNESDEKVVMSEDFNPTDMVYVVNEKATKRLGFENPEEALGVMIVSGVGGIEAPIVGIVKDFHLRSLHEEITPTILINVPMFYYHAGIKINMNNSRETVAFIEDKFHEVFPEQPFQYDFLDDELKEFYGKEDQAFRMFMTFSGLSIFISCLGLLGMISFVVAQRTKEVGIRKVLGAGVNSIVILFTKDFLTLVLMAFAMAAPIAWYFMEQWLSDFAYRIDMNVWYFAIAIIISATITLATIGAQSFRAAVSNPVNALRNE